MSDFWLYAFAIFGCWSALGMIALYQAHREVSKGKYGPYWWTPLRVGTCLFAGPVMLAGVLILLLFKWLGFVVYFLVCLTIEAVSALRRRT